MTVLVKLLWELYKVAHYAFCVCGNDYNIVHISVLDCKITHNFPNNNNLIKLNKTNSDFQVPFISFRLK